jgi:hypothetical protein
LILALDSDAFISWPRYVVMLIISEVYEFMELYNNPNATIRESLIEMRYRLRQKMLQYSAFQGIMVYEPHPVMKKLMHRLFVKYQVRAESVVYLYS